MREREYKYSHTTSPENVAQSINDDTKTAIMNGGLGSLVARPCLARLLRPAGRMAAAPSSSSTPSAAAAADFHPVTTATSQQQRRGGRFTAMGAASASTRRTSITSSTPESVTSGGGDGGSLRRSVVTRGKKGGFMAEMEEIKEDDGHRVEFTLPLAIQVYPSAKLREKNKTIGVFDEELAKLAEAMFKIMYDTEGVGLAAPQVGVNYRMMVYNEAGEAGSGKEVVLVNPKITKFSKSKDMFEEGCLSFPKIYADVEVREERRTARR